VTNYIGTHFGLTEREAAEDKIRNLVFFDYLTRLPNRELLVDRLEQAMASSACHMQVPATSFSTEYAVPSSFQQSRTV
jgi:GGDEF domain-containing protein